LEKKLRGPVREKRGGAGGAEKPCTEWGREKDSLKCFGEVEKERTGEKETTALSNRGGQIKWGKTLR